MSNGEPIIIDVKGIVEKPTWRLWLCLITLILHLIIVENL
jgi:hypothetical protein